MFGHDPALTPVRDFDGARDLPGPRDRLEEVRRRARRFRERLLEGPEVRYFRSFPLVRVPYPTRYALRDAYTGRTPLCHILNRLFVVQVDAGLGDGSVRTVLVSPSDVDRNRETPFFKRMAERFGPFEEAGTRFLAPRYATVESCLAEIGLRPDDVDYLTYDHLHTQDLRRWLGGGGEASYFTRARLLVTRAEWESARSLLPTQADWYCPGGVEVPGDRVVPFEGDLAVGLGLALIRTPGHTAGNHSIVVRAGGHVFVTSENGVGPDSYAPERSRIKGVAKWAKATGAEVVPNGNTLEGSVEQYVSMVQEKEIAGVAPGGEFPDVLSSSELAGYWGFPGLRPTFGHGDVAFGEPVVPSPS